MEEQIWLRATKKHKTALKSAAKSRGMTLVDYIRYKLIDTNPDLSDAGSIYHCPSGEHYNYIIASYSMFNFLLLNSLLKKAYGQEETSNIISKSFNESIAKLQKNYGYKKIKDKNDE